MAGGGRVHRRRRGAGGPRIPRRRRDRRDGSNRRSRCRATRTIGPGTVGTHHARPGSRRTARPGPAPPVFPRLDDGAVVVRARPRADVRAHRRPCARAGHRRGRFRPVEGPHRPAHERGAVGRLHLRRLARSASGQHGFGRVVDPHARADPGRGVHLDPRFPAVAVGQGSHRPVDGRRPGHQHCGVGADHVRTVVPARAPLPHRRPRRPERHAVRAADRRHGTGPDRGAGGSTRPGRDVRKGRGPARSAAHRSARDHRADHGRRAIQPRPRAGLHRVDDRRRLDDARAEAPQRRRQHGGVAGHRHRGGAEAGVLRHAGHERPDSGVGVPAVRSAHARHGRRTQPAGPQRRPRRGQRDQKDLGSHGRGRAGACHRRRTHRRRGDPR